MTKSLRSKFKRKMRSIMRTKKEPKVLKKLEEALSTHTIEEINKAVDESRVQQMESESAEQSTLNTKTMKKADGSFPSWLSGRKQKQAKKSAKKHEQNKNKKKKRLR